MRVSGERSWAVIPWIGWVAGGPILALVAYGVSRSQGLDRARAHAKAALLMWGGALVAWLPVFVTGVVMRPTEPAGYAIVVALTLGALTFAGSVVGVIVALALPRR